MEEKNVNFLIGLLEDPDEFVFTEVGDNLISKGSELIPLLEHHWESTDNELIQTRIENIIHKIQFNSLKQEFYSWCVSQSGDLLKAAYLIARHKFPDLKIDNIYKSIGSISHDVWLELNVNLTALEKVKILNHIIFRINKFTTYIKYNQSPAYYYINQVLESKKASQALIAVLYSEIARQLEIPVYIVLLPKNFILAYVDNVYDKEDPGNNLRNPVLFYINPFDKGNVLGKKEIEYFLDQQQIEPEEFYFYPADNLKIIGALIKELITVYEKMTFNDKAEELKELLKMTEK